MNTTEETSSEQNPVALILRGPGYELDLPTDAVALRNELVEQAQTIQAVTGDASNRIAAAIRGKLKGTIEFVEETRKKVKDAPFRKCQEIDEAAKNFNAPLIGEELRIKALQNAHEFKILSEQRAAEARRHEELNELARKERELARQAQEAKDAAQQKIDSANSESEKEAAAKTAAQEAERISIERSKLAQVQVAAAPVRAKVQGQTVKTVWAADVTDIRAAYAAAPHLFKPLEISPAALKAALSNGLRECPGLRIYETVDTQQRQS